MLHLVTWTKCCSRFKNRLLSVQPLLLQTPIAPAGAPFIKPAIILLRGKIIVGGMYWPLALIAQTVVTVDPRSALDIFDTCRLPSVAAAVVHETVTKTTRLPNNASIFRAELYAISLARAVIAVEKRRILLSSTFSGQL